LSNFLLFPRDTEIRREPQPVQCRGRLVRSCAITIERRRDRTPTVQSPEL